jgi:Uma2 family endonuclease
MTAPARELWTPSEFLAWERRQPTKHGYLRGEIVAMAGASREHNLIVANVLALLVAALRDRPCEAYPSDMRVWIPAAERYTYPDVTVVCGGPEFQDDTFDTLLNPMMLVEVLSDSTEAEDRGKKLHDYATLPSVHEVLLVAQDEALVDHYVRRAEGGWTVQTIATGGTVECVSLGLSVPVEDLYRKVFTDLPRRRPTAPSKPKKAAGAKR